MDFSRNGGNVKSVLNNYRFLNVSRTSSIFPQVILPSVHGPATQFGPEFEKMPGTIFLTSLNISVASSLISH